MKFLYKKIGHLAYWLLLPLIRIVIRRTRRVHVALITDGRIILVKNWLARDTWRLPGGGINRGETEAHCAVREMDEELGIKINADRLIRLASGTNKVDGLGYAYTLFAYSLNESPLIKIDKFEITEYGIFANLPDNSQDGLADAIDTLRCQKML